jgi:DNA-binding response OmpR family regulator
LVLAGSGQAEQLLTALEARADEYVLKPLNPDLLKARLILVERPYQRHIQQRYVEEEELCIQNEESLVSYDESVISPLP